jgi:hypothetical protein
MGIVVVIREKGAVRQCDFDELTGVVVVVVGDLTADVAKGQALARIVVKRRGEARLYRAAAMASPLFLRTSCSMILSSDRSATRRLSLAFSSSSCFSFLAWLGSSLP